MKTTVTGMQKLKRKLTNLQKQTKAAPNTISGQATNLIAGIINRTLASKSVSGTRFTPYSPNYRRSQTPTLCRTGAMLGAITWARIKGGVRLYFANSASLQKALVHQFGSSRAPRRPFFGLDNRQTTNLVNKLKVKP